MDNQLTVFETDEGFTLAFGTRMYYIHRKDPFFNIAKICIEKNDYVPFYIEMARQEAKGLPGGSHVGNGPMTGILDHPGDPGSPAPPRPSQEKAL